MGSDEAFCLKWNDFQGSISSSLGSLRTTSDLLDVTVQCGKESLQCHRLVLSACSDWFKAVFRALPAVTQHPVIVLWEATARDMALLLDFMYNGEVNVKQENLNSFLALAEKLSVRGLTQGQGGGGGDEKDRDRHKEPVRQPPPSQTSTPVVRRQEDRGETVKRQRVEHRAPEQRVVQQHHEVEEVAVVKQEVTREVEQVEQVVEEYGSYQEGGEVAQYEGDNMYDNYYEGDDGSQADYSQMDNSQQMASKVYPRENIKKTSNYPTISTTPLPYPSPTSYSNTPNKMAMVNFCEICGRDYANIKQHNDDLHNPNKQPVSCPVCGKVFASKNSMRVHKSTLHRDQP